MELIGKILLRLIDKKNNKDLTTKKRNKDC